MERPARRHRFFAPALTALAALLIGLASATSTAAASGTVSLTIRLDLETAGTLRPVRTGVGAPPLVATATSADGVDEVFRTYAERLSALLDADAVRARIRGVAESTLVVDSPEVVLATGETPVSVRCSGRTVSSL